MPHMRRYSYPAAIQAARALRDAGYTASVHPMPGNEYQIRYRLCEELQDDCLVAAQAAIRELTLVHTVLPDADGNLRLC